MEADAVMLGQSVSMVLPQVVGYRLTGCLGNLTTSTDLVLTITEVLIISFHCCLISRTLLSVFFISNIFILFCYYLITLFHINITIFGEV